jgi:hypothetical protein
MRAAILAGALALGSAGCAPANPLVVKDGPGFFWGLAHGAIAPIALVAALFKDDVNIYATHNDGGLYNLGFLLGVSVWAGGGHEAHRRRRRRPRENG